MTLISGQVGQSAGKLYAIAAIYLVTSILWWTLFRTMKSIYVLSIPFGFYGLAFLLLGIAPYVTGLSRTWVQNVATGLYATASSSGAFYFSLNFGSEGKLNNRFRRRQRLLTRTRKRSCRNVELSGLRHPGNSTDLCDGAMALGKSSDTVEFSRCRRLHLANLSTGLDGRYDPHSCDDVGHRRHSVSWLARLLPPAARPSPIFLRLHRT